jgi:hypothetical protein
MFWITTLTEAQRAIVSQLITLVGILLGGGLALLGVRMTIAGNARNLAKQLTHASVEREREWKMALRRDVYLGAAEGLSMQLGAAMRLNSLQVSDAVVTEEFQAGAGLLAKLHLVADVATVEALFAFSLAMGSLWGRMAAARARAQMKDSEATSRAQIRDEALLLQKRMIELMRQFNLSPGERDGAWDAIQTQAVQAQATQKKWADLCTESLHSRNAELLETFDIFVREQPQMFALIIKLVIACRNELDLAVDEATYDIVVTKQIDGSRMLSEELRESIRKLIETAQKAAP